MCLFFDSALVAQRISKVFKANFTEKDARMTALDFTSFYPSLCVHHSIGISNYPCDQVSFPWGTPVTIEGEECLLECDASCTKESVHTCNFNCERKCPKIGRGSHICSENCQLQCCFDEDPAMRCCSRKDTHDCDEGVNCFQVCSRHYPPIDWRKCPSAVRAILLPPQSKTRFPLLRVTILTIDNVERLIPALCLACAKKERNFEAQVNSCNHSPEERMIEGMFYLLFN